MTGGGGVLAQREVALVDLLDRLLAGGVVIAGDLTLRIADVDLVRIGLNALVSSVSAQVPSPFVEFDDPTDEPFDEPEKTP
ncbi:gas vesicle protein [Streptomyces sp. BR1]|uniref:gas vesicle protein n=1 Tax=Streptomyces sp. BR1 TaxID=1592323 RepID=UPI00402B8D41